MHTQARSWSAPFALGHPWRVGEFLRLLYIIAHRRTSNWFRQQDNEEPSDDTFKFRHGQYFWHTRTAIGHAAARAVAQRVHVAEHT